MKKSLHVYYAGAEQKMTINICDSTTRNSQRQTVNSGTQ
jgi:hypothetical protein